MKKKRVDATVENILNLFSHRLDDFAGESHRSYTKAYSSFQLYLVGNYQSNSLLKDNMIKNWLADMIMQGLSKKTVTFYLDKIAALYSGIADKLIGGKTLDFKEIKTSLKNIDFSPEMASNVTRCFQKVKNLWKKYQGHYEKNLLLSSLIHATSSPESLNRNSLKYIWACVALKSNVKADIVKTICGDTPDSLEVLNLYKLTEVTEKEKTEALFAIRNALKGEELKWFAMRLRPKVKYEDIIERFSRISDLVKIPEIFYPSEEIAKRVGRKVVWEGKPIIRDIIFFKDRKSEVFHLFTKLWDLAWCYRVPGGGSGDYASIPTRAMEEFKKAIGILTPDLEIAPSGEMEFKPGDVVVVVNGNNVEEQGEILKKASYDADGNKIFRVRLLKSNGRWDIGIDARLLKKA